MTDVSQIVPTLDVSRCSEQLFNSFDEANLQCADIAALSETMGQLTTRLRRPADEINGFVDALRASTVPKRPQKMSDFAKEVEYFTSGDSELDRCLFDGRGIGTRSITELCGASGVGKSNFLTQLCVGVQLPRLFGGLDKNAIYISTEAGLETRRLNEMVRAVREQHAHSPEVTVSAGRVFCITCSDLESQEHILTYQLVHAIRTRNVGLVVLDSIASHYRAESGGGQGSATSRRTIDLLRCEAALRRAARAGCAVVVANQVTDLFGSETSLSPRDYETHGDVFALDMQTRFYSGWKWPDGDERPKLPAMGQIWASSVDTRLVMRRQGMEDDDGQPSSTVGRRTMAVVFSSRLAPHEATVEIWTGGVRYCQA
ncbi:P-loop containing nucleoside triphosphate hydrolase protein [Lipomyces oligophaga]|uniref:P-loop containing nucleoside triphosphate hydrolase protein n=1 Tax=Lipomyces oligophaga TaxID=45792 RepID=UPI0034CEFC2A